MYSKILACFLLLTIIIIALSSIVSRRGSSCLLRLLSVLVGVPLLFRGHYNGDHGRGSSGNCEYLYIEEKKERGQK